MYHIGSIALFWLILVSFRVCFSGRAAGCGIKAATAVFFAFKNEAGLQFNPDAFRYRDGLSLMPESSIIVNSEKISGASMNRGGIEGNVIGEAIIFEGAAAGCMLPLVCAGLSLVALRRVSNAIASESLAQIAVTQAGRRSGGVPAAVLAGISPDAWGMLLPLCWAVLLSSFAGFLVGPRLLAGLVAGTIFGAGALALLCAGSGSGWVSAGALVAYGGAAGGGSETIFPKKKSPFFHITNYFSISRFDLRFRV